LPGTEKGSILLTAMYTIVVLTLILLGAATLAQLEGTIGVRHVRSLQAAYLAEGAIDVARATIFCCPAVLEDPAFSYDLELETPELQGEAKVQVTRPSRNGSIIIQARATLADGAKKRLEVSLTAPPAYALYSQGLCLNPVLNMTGIHIEYPLEGQFIISPGTQGAYQVFEGIDEPFPEEGHTHRYRPPVMAIDYWKKAAAGDRADWGSYTYHYIDGSTSLPPVLSKAIYAVDGDVLIHGSVQMADCIIIASGDISAANTGSQSSNIEGLLFAGRNINLYQAEEEMRIYGNLVAAGNINAGCGGNICLTSPSDQEYVRRAPLGIRNKLGFLSMISYKEIMN